jgi:hypothetical protein
MGGLPCGRNQAFQAAKKDQENSLTKSNYLDNINQIRLIGFCSASRLEKDYGYESI